MSYLLTPQRALAALLVAMTAALFTVSASAEEEHQVVVMHTFDVHADAKTFIEMLDKGIRMAREADPEGGGEIYVLAGHVEPEAASQVIVYTAYPNMDAYVANKEAMENDPRMQSFAEKMEELDFKIVDQSINTLVAEY
jgi:hypothetical protein